MFPEDLGSSFESLALVAVSSVAIYLALIMYSRLAGLRSFAQMTNFDLAATVAFGSITATTAVSTNTSLVQGLLALGVLFVVQALIARVRRYRSIEHAVDNRPLLLMCGSDVLAHNLAKAQMTREDLNSKLRLAGVTRVEQVRAVVLEATGEVSVLTEVPNGRTLEPGLFAGIDGEEWLTATGGPARSDGHS
ncbi:DUF421 domain-containing protein [Haloechinothrix sp. YIM 98757]|uniref:DUF421 domain-containing protein n=1 Tax=Haloechinothrix aidingensis TaxID=2752311 RepID=A0A838A7L6_9PSEU|nr:YetF domain-containing protein [Haloechinothrix aidingensis]MBA0124289.1 DUF421 domain-containing protein [Haloechinothrix aidingensis]